MKSKRFLSAVVLTVVTWMIVGPSVAVALEPGDDTLSLPVNHDDGVPCPDGDDGGPCNDGCPCICCPGHTTVMFAPSIDSLETPRLSSAYRFGPLESDHPCGVRQRIFRPPRV